MSLMMFFAHDISRILGFKMWSNERYALSSQLHPLHVLARARVRRVPRAPLRLVEPVTHRQATGHKLQ